MVADFKNGQLARRLTFLVVLLATLPLLIGGGLAAYSTYQFRFAEVADRQELTVLLGKAFFEDYLANLLANLNLAGGIAFQNPAAPDAAFTLLCANYPDRYPELILADQDGRVLSYWKSCRPADLTGVENPAEKEPFFRAMRSGNYVGTVSFLQDNRPLVPISAAVKGPMGEVRVVMAVVNLQELWQPLSELIPPEEGYFYLVDRRGSLVGSGGADPVRHVKTLTSLPTVFPLISQVGPAVTRSIVAMQYPGLFEQGVIGSSALIENSGWVIVVEQPTQQAFERQIQLMAGLLVLIGLVLLIAGGLSLRVVQQLMHPVHALAQGAEAIARGDFTHTIPVTSTDELGTVGRAFNLMTTRLRELIRNLEYRVQEQRDAEMALRRQLKELSVLNAIATAAAEMPNETALIERTSDLLGALLDPDSFGILLVDETAKLLRTQPTRCLAASARGAEIPLGLGITGRVALEGRPRRIGDVLADPHYLALIPEARSELCVPLRVGERVIGVLNAECTRPNAFTEADERLLITAAGQLATALDRLRAEAVEQRRSLELAVIYDVGRRVTSILALDVLLPQIVALIARTMELYNVEVALVEGREVVFRAGYGGYVEGPSAMPDFRLPLGKGVAGRVALSGEKLLVSDVTTFGNYVPCPSLPSVRSELAVPLRIKEQVIGVLDVKADRIGRLTAADAEMLEILADQVAVAIENARYYQKAVAVARRQTVLRWASQEIVAASLDSERVYQAIHQAASQLMPCEACVIARQDETHQEIEYLYMVDRGKPRPLMRVASDQGLAGHVISSGQAVLVEDSRELVGINLIHFGDPEPTCSVLAVPLRLGERVIGMLSVQSYGVSAYSVDDQGVLEMLAAQAAVAIENARLFAEERRRSQELETLRQASLQVTSRLELYPALEVILDQALRLAGANDAQIFFCDQAMLRFGAALRTGGGGAASEGESWAQAFSLAVVEQGTPLVVPDIGRHPLFQDPSRQGAMVGLPLRSRNQLHGVMNLVFGQPRSFDPNELRALELLADQAAVAVENARLFEATRRQLHELTVLRAVALTGTEATGEDELIERTTGLVRETFEYDGFGVLLLDERAGVLRPHASCVGLKMTGTRGELANQVLRDEKPRRLGEVPPRPGASESPVGVHSLLCVPLKAGQRTIGVIQAESIRANCFTEADERLLTTLAGQLGTTIAQVRLRAETVRALLREQRLNEISRHLSGALDLTAILSNVARLAAELIEADAGDVALLSEDGQRLIYPEDYVFGTPPKLKDAAPSEGRTLDREILENRRPTLLDDPTVGESALTQWVPGVRAFIGVPFVAGELCIGVLGLYSLRPNRGFTLRDLALVESVGRQAGVALQNARLFTEARRRADELAAALVRLEELDRLKNEFIQNVSHELRTPLGIIRGYAELLENGDLGPVPVEQQEPVAIIARRVRMLVRMVGDLTAILEAESRGLHREPVDMVEMVRNLATEFQVQAQKLGLCLITEIPGPLPAVSGDPAHLRRVLDNLVGNAFKFTPAGGAVTIRLNREAGQLILEVADTGIGIPAEKLDRIFERFYQVDGSMSRRYGGTGLGLALVKEIVETHGGMVRASSITGQGTTFQVRLPLGGETA